MSISIPTSGRLSSTSLPDQAGAGVQAPHQAGKAAAEQAAPAVKAPDAVQMREEMRQALERLNEHMQKQGRSLSFSVDEQLNRTIVQVKDSRTGEVVRQIPNEVVLRIGHSLEDFKGLLHNEKT